VLADRLHEQENRDADEDEPCPVGMKDASKGSLHE
jgi:hypothetical protein